MSFARHASSRLSKSALTSGSVETIASSIPGDRNQATINEHACGTHRRDFPAGQVHRHGGSLDLERRTPKRSAKRRPNESQTA
jgi:hypothetical protein